MKIRNLLIVIFMFLASSCSPSKNEISLRFVESISDMNANKMDKATSSAEHLSKYNSGAANFLLTQYGVFTDLIRDQAFDKKSANYKMSKMNLDDKAIYVDSRSPSSYRSQYIAAKLFVALHLNGPQSARQLLKADCWNWQGSNPDMCVHSIIYEESSAYLSTGNKYYAVALYEIAYVSGDEGLGLVSKDESDFFRAISLFDIDHQSSVSIFKHINNANLFDPYARDLYCKILSKNKFSEKDAICIR